MRYTRRNHWPVRFRSAQAGSEDLVDRNGTLYKGEGVPVHPEKTMPAAYNLDESPPKTSKT